MSAYWKDAVFGDAFGSLDAAGWDNIHLQEFDEESFSSPNVIGYSDPGGMPIGIEVRTSGMPMSFYLFYRQSGPMYSYESHRIPKPDEALKMLNLRAVRKIK